MKRSATTEAGSLSPPPVRRKIESTTTSKAVSSFFKPTSQKEPEQTTWRIVNQSLIVGKYIARHVSPRPHTLPQKIAAFDLDDTLITPNGGNKWNRSATSWKWWDATVPGCLKDLYDQGYVVVIISNQGNISLKDNPKSLPKDSLSLVNFKNQVTSVLRQLDMSVSIYAATAQDKYRKPRTGMWQEILEDHDLESAGAVDLDGSFYVGDAAGRDKTDKRRKDHASSDRDLASNIGIAFKTPEEYFLGQSAEQYRRDFEPEAYLTQLLTTGDERQHREYLKCNPQEIVLFCGSPGAGKSTFFWDVLQPQGYVRVNQDILKSRDRCIKVAKEHLMAGSSVAVDNTNADGQTRAHWVRLAREHEIPIRCIRFTAPARLCEHNDTVRALNEKDTNPEARALLPGIAFRSFVQRYVEPSLAEGFQDITTIDFLFNGSPAQRQTWTKYWVSKYAT